MSWKECPVCGNFTTDVHGNSRHTMCSKCSNIYRAEARSPLLDILVGSATLYCDSHNVEVVKFSSRGSGTPTAIATVTFSNGVWIQMQCRLVPSSIIVSVMLRIVCSGGNEAPGLLDDCIHHSIMQFETQHSTLSVDASIEYSDYEDNELSEVNYVVPTVNFGQSEINSISGSESRGINCYLCGKQIAQTQSQLAGCVCICDECAPMLDTLKPRA